MLWFYQSFFSVLWIAFLLYWQIKSACCDRAFSQANNCSSRGHQIRLELFDLSYQRDC
jgi:hypothetical protein